MQIQSFTFTVHPTDILRGVCDALVVASTIAALAAGYFGRFELALVAGGVAALSLVGSLSLRYFTFKGNETDSRLQRLTERLKNPLNEQDLTAALHESHMNIEECSDLQTHIKDEAQVKELGHLYAQCLTRDHSLNQLLRAKIDYKYATSQINKISENLTVADLQSETGRFKQVESLFATLGNSN